APVSTAHARVLCDWLAAVWLPDGGLPFARPVADPAGCAPFWVGADPARPSLQITCLVTAYALEVAEHDNAVARHPWLPEATAFCMRTLVGAPPPATALGMLAAVRFLDRAAARVPGAGD